MCESGAGTGKTFSLLIEADYTAWTHPGARLLFVRRTRVSMNTAPLPEFEKEVLWPGHPALMTGSAHFKDRQFYRYPNGSEIWLAGFDSQQKIDDILSSKWDRVYIFQAEQMRLEDIEKLITRLRNFGAGYHQLTLDVNPAPPEHWIAKRFGLVRGKGIWNPSKNRAVFSYRHEDNPAWYDAEAGRWTDAGEEYVHTILDTLTGTRRERLLHHRWVSAEGMVWEDYDPEKHIIYGSVTPKPNGRASLEVRGWEKPVELMWFLGAFDWGFHPDPASFGCYGIDRDGRMYQIVEEYRLSLTQDEWAEKIGAIYKKYPMRAIVADDDGAFIKTMNRWLSNYHGGRDVGRIVRKADKQQDHGEKSGIDIARQRWRARPDGTYGCYILSDALVEPDPELKSREAPLCLADEIPSYVYRQVEDGKPHKEEPDPLCIDHGCDRHRYACKWVWGRDLAEKDPVASQMVHAPGTIEGQYERRHRELLEKLGRVEVGGRRKW